MPGSGPIFCKRNGERQRDVELTRSIRKYLAALGIDASSHQLRHWFGTNVYATCHDLRITQELLGHRDPSTATKYVAFSPVEAAEVLRSLHVESKATSPETSSVHVTLSEPPRAGQDPISAQVPSFLEPPTRRVRRGR